MALLNLFGKKKKEFKAVCTITHEPLEQGFGYLLTTAQIISSKKYWDWVMTEPEMMSYTISHFNNQPGGTHMRHMVFEKYAAITQPWMVSDSVINYFEVDKTEAREGAKKWWASEGNYTPQPTGIATLSSDNGSIKTWKEYAVLEAGRSRAAAARR